MHCIISATICVIHKSPAGFSHPVLNTCSKTLAKGRITTRKSKLCLVVLCLVMFSLVSPCYAVTPQKIAILPVINRTYTHDAAVENVISAALAAKFRMPLANIVSIYEVVPAAEVRAALPADIHNRAQARKFGVDKLPAIAAKLNADIVIGAIITDLSEERTITGKDSFNFQRTVLAIRVVGYRAREGTTFAVGDHQEYRGDWSRLGDADYLAGVIMDKLLESLVFPYDKE